MSTSKKNIFLPIVCPVFDNATPMQMRETSSRFQGGVVLWFLAEAAQQARERAIAHCSLRIHIKHRDASCCERHVYDISISLNWICVFEWWISYDLVLRLKILRKHLYYFGISEKQDSSQVKPQQCMLHTNCRAVYRWSVAN